jgi:glycosyltransferase involved in cell wall biosynthesis
MEKLKIAVIGLKGLPAFGGAATVGENIINQLKNEYRFYVYSVASHTSQKGEYDGYYQIVFNKFLIKKLNVFLYYIKSLFHCLFVQKYDLIHLHHVDGAFILPFLRLRYKVVVTSHAQPQVNEKWPSYVKLFFKLNERLALLFANEITAVSKNLTREYQKMTGKPVHYIPNGINPQEKVSEKPIPQKDYILFAAGRIIPLKGLHVLLDAMNKTKGKQKLLAIGDLNQLPKYKEKILALAQNLDVEFVDIIKIKAELLNYVKKAKLFIFPSYSENMSMMLLEAAYVKTPVICSDIIQNKDIFSDNEVLFFETNNAQDLADKIDWAKSNSDAMEKIANNALVKLYADFTWPVISKQYENLYLKCISN